LQRAVSALAEAGLTARTGAELEFVLTQPDGIAEVMCSARNLSGTRAIAAFVSSMHTGRMKIAPSAMLRERSMA